MKTRIGSLATLPLIVAFILLTIGGVFLLSKADRQMRDTTRKHHIEDIERSLYVARLSRGTYPPYTEATWCGVLNDPKNREVRNQVEEALRIQNEKYENPEKPFPSDPSFANQAKDYFYWKRSPSVFELYSILEEDPNGERNTSRCKNAETTQYDYGISSILRKNTEYGTVMDSIL